MTDDNQEYVYAIGHPHGYVKIGRSANPMKRLNNHQTSTPYELWLIVSLPVDDSRAVENELHEHFSEKLVRGEWFELDYDDYDMLADLMKMAGSKEEFEGVGDYRKYQRRKREAIFG